MCHCEGWFCTNPCRRRDAVIGHSHKRVQRGGRGIGCGPWHLNFDRVVCLRGRIRRDLTTKFHRLIRICDVEDDHCTLSETRHFQFIPGAAGERQGIRVGRVGVRICNLDRLQQADIVFPILRRQRDGVRTVLQKAGRNVNSEFSFGLTGEGQIAQRGAVQSNGNVVWDRENYALQNQLQTHLLGRGGVEVVHLNRLVDRQWKKRAARRNCCPER